jgi:hypothetical protein
MAKARWTVTVDPETGEVTFNPHDEDVEPAMGLSDPIVLWGIRFEKFHDPIFNDTLEEGADPIFLMPGTPVVIDPGIEERSLVPRFCPVHGTRFTKPLKVWHNRRDYHLIAECPCCGCQIGMYGKNWFI